MAERRIDILPEASTPPDRWQFSGRTAQDAVISGGTMRLFKYALPILFAAGLAMLGARAWTARAASAERKLWPAPARHPSPQRAAVARAAPDRARSRDAPPAPF